MPSTSTTVQGACLARAAAAISAALLPPAASVTAASHSSDLPSTLPDLATVTSAGIAGERMEISTVMQRSTDRIRTTHAGSLARPPALLDLMKAEAAGNPAGPDERAGAERVAVADVVTRQRAAGLDVISDGE